MSHVRCLAPALTFSDTAVEGRANPGAAFDETDATRQDMLGAWHRTGAL